ncbi:hypothetical protein ACFQ8S_00805 [Streptomyces virginiae]
MTLGSTEWIPTTLALDGAPAAACDTHLILICFDPQDDRLLS